MKATFGLLLASLLLSGLASARQPLLETLAGQGVAVDAPLPGRLVLFWHPDCSYCMQELAALKQADSSLRSQLTTIALLPGKTVRKGAYALPDDAGNFASRANPLDILEHYGNAAGTLPYGFVSHVDGSLCRQLNGSQDIAGLQAALAACH